MHLWIEKFLEIFIYPLFPESESNRIKYQEHVILTSLMLVVTLILFLQVFIGIPLEVGYSPALLSSLRFVNNALAMLAFLVLYFLSRTEHYSITMAVSYPIAFIYAYIILDPRLSPFNSPGERLVIFLLVFIIVMLLTGYISSPVHVIPIGIAGAIALTIYYVQYRESLTAIPELVTLLLYVAAIVAFILIYSLLRERYQKAHEFQTESLKQANRELEEQKAKAQAATSAKNVFMAKMSHEIRTPMNLILGATYVLEDDSSERHKEKFLRILQRESNLLLNLVNDLLDISIIDAGKFELHISEFDLVSVVEDMIHSFKQVAGRKGVSLSVDIKDNVAPAYEGDPNRFLQVLRNLVDNAIKYTSKGEVTVRVDQNQENLNLVVSDTGQGMTENEIQKVFQPFERGTSPVTLSKAGFGLGLSIVRQLVDMMGGDIQVESSPGEGTEFTVMLPLKAVEKPVLVKDQATRGKKPLHVLVVDDVEDNRELMGILLEKDGHTVSYAENGLEAVTKRQTGQYDLIFMDILMEPVDGYATTKIIRKWEQDHNKPRVPIVALTGIEFKDNVEKYLEAGCDSWLTKPFRKGDLAETIAKLA